MVTREQIKKEVDRNYSIVQKRMTAAGIDIAGFTPNKTIEYLFQLSVTGNDISSIIPDYSIVNKERLSIQVQKAVNENYEVIKAKLNELGYHADVLSQKTMPDFLIEKISTGEISGRLSMTGEESGVEKITVEDVRPTFNDEFELNSFFSQFDKKEVLLIMVLGIIFILISVE
jgi:hypothetical protein